MESSSACRGCAKLIHKPAVDVMKIGKNKEKKCGNVFQVMLGVWFGSLQTLTYLDKQ